MTEHNQQQTVHVAQPSHHSAQPPQPEQHHGAQPREISWQAMEFQEYKKHPLWFLAFGIIIALLVLFGILAGSWTTAVLFGLCGVLGLIFSVKKPREVTIKLSGLGVHVNNVAYNYRVIKKFWVIYNPPQVKVLYLETSAYLNHIVKLELGNQEPLKVKEYLKQYIEEDLDADESIADRIARHIRF